MKTITLTRSIWVKGKGMPKDGVCLFSEGEQVEVIKEGRQHYILGFYKGKQIRIATIL